MDQGQGRVNQAVAVNPTTASFAFAPPSAMFASQQATMNRLAGLSGVQGPAPEVPPGAFAHPIGHMGGMHGQQAQGPVSHAHPQHPQAHPHHQQQVAAAMQQHQALHQHQQAQAQQQQAAQQGPQAQGQQAQPGAVAMHQPLQQHSPQQATVIRAQRGGGARKGGEGANGYADINTLVSVCQDLPEMRAAPSTPADFVYGGNCPGLQLLNYFDGKAEADSTEAFLSQINPVKTMVINKLPKIDCPNPKRWNESQKVLYPCREHSSVALRVKIGPQGNRTEQVVNVVACFSTNCKRSYWKLKSSARNWMCYFDNTELSEQCRVKCMCNPQRCSSCDEAKCAGTDTFTAKPLLKQLEWLWDRHKGVNALNDLAQQERVQAIVILERMLTRLKESVPPSALLGREVAAPPPQLIMATTGMQAPGVQGLLGPQPSPAERQAERQAQQRAEEQHEALSLTHKRMRGMGVETVEHLE